MGVQERKSCRGSMYLIENQTVASLIFSPNYLYNRNFYSIFNPN